jgi:putative membrane protein
MKNLAGTFLSEAEREQVEACVRRVEMNTAAEIVPLIAPSASGYPRAALAAAVACGLLLAVAVGWFLGGLAVWEFAALFGVGLFAGELLNHSLPVLRKPFLSRREMAFEVDEAAHLAFLSHEIFATRDRTGILVFVSVYERRVRILADSGIAAQVGQETWDQVAVDLVAGIRAGKRADALCAAVERCGALVAAAFPRKADDTDELPNLIVEGKPGA